MKKSIYLIAALCLSAFSSCSSDGNPASEPGQEQTARIELNLLGSGTTRAVGAALPSNEQNVNNIVVGIFDGDGNKLLVQEVTSFTIGSPATVTIPLVKGTMTRCTGVVVGNVPATSVTALESTTTKSSFLEQTISLADATASGDNQVSNTLPMSGDVNDVSGEDDTDGNADGDNNSATFTLTSGMNKTGLAVSLVRMVSRVALTAIATDFTETAYPDATLKLQRVFLREAISTNSVTTSAVPADAMPSGATYISGGGTWNETTWVDDVNNYLFDDLTGSEVDISSGLPGSNYYWFYAFANDGNSNPTAFVIQCVFNSGEDGASDETVFYPVIVNKNQSGTSYSGGASTGTATGNIIRNHLYNLSVTIKSKGATSPTDNLNPVDLSITVNVEDWPAAIVQSVVFN